MASSEYILSDLNFNFLRYVSGKYLRKYHIPNLEKRLNSGECIQLRNYLLYLNPSRKRDEKFKKIHENEFFSYYISNNSYVYRIDKDDRSRERVEIKKSNNGQLYIEIEKKKYLLANLLLNSFRDDKPQNYKIIYKDNNESNLNLTNLDWLNTEELEKYNKEKKIEKMKKKLCETYKVFYENASYIYFISKTGRGLRLNKENIKVEKIEKKDSGVDLYFVIENKKIKVAELLIEHHFDKPPLLGGYDIQYVDDNYHNLKLDNIKFLYNINNMYEFYDDLSNAFCVAQNMLCSVFITEKGTCYKISRISLFRWEITGSTIPNRKKTIHILEKLYVMDELMVKLFYEDDLENIIIEHIDEDNLNCSLDNLRIYKKINKEKVLFEPKRREIKKKIMRI